MNRIPIGKMELQPIPRRPLILPGDGPHPAQSTSVSNSAIAVPTTPRRDYDLIASRTAGDLLFPGGRTWAEATLAYDLRQASIAYSRHEEISAYLSLSERVGVPLGEALHEHILFRKPVAPHVLVAHRLDTRRKTIWQSITRWQDSVTRFVVLCRSQARFLRENGVDSVAIDFVFDSIDTQFWNPFVGGIVMETPAQEEDDLKPVSGEPFLLCVGQEARDWETLRQAAGERFPLVVVNGGAWTARRKNTKPLSHEYLRGLYQQARAVVVPILPDTNYAAGVNALLEGMAMQKPIIVTQTPGLVDYLNPDAHFLCTAGDIESMRESIAAVWGDAAAGTQKAAYSRQLAIDRHPVERYADTLALIVREIERA